MIKSVLLIKLIWNSTFLFQCVQCASRKCNDNNGDNDNNNNNNVGRDSSVGIATRYGLDGPGIKSRVFSGVKVAGAWR